jgi:PAS domain S-box-containing protein
MTAQPLPSSAPRISNALKRILSRMARSDSSRSPLAVVCVVTALSYLVPKLGGALISNPRTVWPLWPGCAILVSGLLLVPLRIWPILIPAALAAFALYDVQAGVPGGSIAWFQLADTVQVLIAAIGLRYCFDGVPRLNSIKALAKYSFFAVILGPFAAAFLSARGIGGDYWAGWKICFFSEALAFVALTPAILSWVSEGRAWVRKSRASQLEAVALIAGLVLVGYIAFTASDTTNSPALLYSLVPFLLWSALCFGSTGSSTAVVLVAFLSIWGAVHGRGPFTERGLVCNLMSLQLFVVFAATPFMVLAAVVEERGFVQEELRVSEDKLRLLLDSTAEGIFEIDLAGRCTFCNTACFQLLGYDRVDELLGKNMHHLIHHTRADGTSLPAEECRIFLAFKSGKGVHVEDEVLWRANGTSFPAEYWSYPQLRGQVVVGAVVAFIDITERKLAELALANVSRRLIEAQEQERIRIARELHDDFAQRLALLAVELEKLHQNHPDLPELRRHAGELHKRTSEIATDIHTLSRELHSTKLQYLGIAAAIRGFCQEFGEQTKVKIDFKSHDLPSPLSPDVSLCLFRVLQEALHNSAKHSGVRHVEVRLWGTSDEILLMVSDSGAGFDPEAAKRSQGLGLISMEERLKLVNGTFSIESQPERGTTIHARVPLNSGSDSMLATG